MRRLADVTLGDLARGLGRYRPVIVAVAVMVVALQVLPDRTPRVAAPARGQPASTAGGPQVAGGDDDAFSDDAAMGDAGDDGGAFSDDDVPFDYDDSGFADGSFEDEDFAEDDGSFFEDEGDGSAFDDEDFDGGGGDGGSLEDDEFFPLFVMEYGWASATAGTPVASSDVPSGSMPIGKRIGQNDKISFVRLVGTATVLELREAAAGQRRPPIGEAGVQVCQSDEADWSGGEAQTFDAAPSWDSDECVEGVRADDGTWTFDLGGFESPEDRRGFVLVPAGDAVDFQVALEPH